MGLVGLPVRRLNPFPLVPLRIGCGVVTKWLSSKLKRAWAKGVSFDDLLLLAARPSSKATSEREEGRDRGHSLHLRRVRNDHVGRIEGGREPPIRAQLA